MSKKKTKSIGLRVAFCRLDRTVTNFIERVKKLEEKVEENDNTLDYYDGVVIPGFQQELHSIKLKIEHKDIDIMISQVKNSIKKLEHKCEKNPTQLDIDRQLQGMNMEMQERLGRLEDKCENCIPHGHTSVFPDVYGNPIKITTLPHEPINPFKIHLNDKDIEDALSGSRYIPDSYGRLAEVRFYPKEANSWKVKYLDAIKESIEKIWEPRSRAEEVKRDCPVCEVAEERHDRDRPKNPQDIRAQMTNSKCDYCPIKWKTGESSCKGTPYVNWIISIEDDYPNVAKQMARDEVNFLKQLYYDLLFDKIKDPFEKKS